MKFPNIFKYILGQLINILGNISKFVMPQKVPADASGNKWNLQLPYLFSIVLLGFKEYYCFFNDFVQKTK